MSATTGGPVRARFVRDVALAAAADLLKSLRAIIVIPVLAKLLGAADYGIWVQIKVTATLLSPVILLGLNYSIVRFISGIEDAREIREGLNSAVHVTAFAGVLLGVLMFFFSEPLGHVLFQGRGSPYYVKIVALFVLFDGLDQLALAYFQASRRMAAHASFITVEIVVEACLVAALAVAGLGLPRIMTTLVGWKCAVTVLKLGLIWSRIGLSRPSPEALGPYVTFGLPLMLSSLFYFVLNYGDRYLIGALLGIREVGLYSVAYAIGSLPVILTTPIDYVLYPAIAGAWNRGDRNGVRESVRHSMKYTLLIVIPVFFGLAVLARPLVLLLSTPEFLPAASSVPLIVLGFLFFGIGITGERVILLANRPRLIVLLYAGLAGLNVGLNLLLLPVFGIVGAAVATLVTFGFYAVFTLTVARGYCRISLEPSVVWKGGLAGLAMALVIGRFDAGSVAGVVAAVFFGGAAYIAALVLLRVFAREEAVFLRTLVGTLVKRRALGKVWS